MGSSRNKMKPLDEEIERLSSEIARLQAELSAFRRARAIVAGEVEEASTPQVHRRSPNVKPLVLDIMAQAGDAGATSAEVTALVQKTYQSVTRDSVGSILSRLKGMNALVHDGERYFDAKFAPKEGNTFLQSLKVVN